MAGITSPTMSIILYGSNVRAGSPQFLRLINLEMESISCDAVLSPATLSLSVAYYTSLLWKGHEYR